MHVSTYVNNMYMFNTGGPDPSVEHVHIYICRLQTETQWNMIRDLNRVKKNLPISV